MGMFDGIEPICYSRNVEMAGYLVFQPGNIQKSEKERKEKKGKESFGLLRLTRYWPCYATKQP